MKKYLILILLLLITKLCLSQTPTGEFILKKIDENTSSKNKIALSKMIIHSRRGSRTIEAKSWIEGNDKSFTEYLSPVREKGIKMLKLQDQLWTYSPATDRIIQISGHLLRQSVMGSDLSYEDIMEDPKLQNIYNAELIGEQAFEDRVCWLLQLTAEQKDAVYFSRKIWGDKERCVALKEERFAKSGKLLKSTEVKEVMFVDNRWIPQIVVFKDELKTGMGTEFIIDSIEYDVQIADYIFTKAVLRK